jgi:hypothetical protein
MEGALRMQEAHAKMIKDGINKQRYGEQTTVQTKVVNGTIYYKVQGGWSTNKP